MTYQKLQVKIIDKCLYDDYQLPRYATQGSAGLDLRIDKSYTLEPNCTALVSAGLQVYIKDPYICGLIVPRSGLGHEGIVLGNLTGVIDSDYQGELKISLWNRTNITKCLYRGDRVAQLILIPVIKSLVDVVEEFDEVTARQGDGFGSTGVF